MPEIPPAQDAPQFHAAARGYSVRDGVLLGLVLVTIVRTGEALAGDQAAFIQPAADPDLTKFGRPAPSAAAILTDTQQIFAAPPLKDEPVFSSTDFTPRKHTLFDAEPVGNAFSDAPMLRGTTVWQRMADYKSRDRVRLLTLWESSGSTVSLQAGHRGDPSLQWTSRLMNRGGSTQGLLDRWFSVSLAHATSTLRGVARSTGSVTNPKPAGAAGVADLK